MVRNKVLKVIGIISSVIGIIASIVWIVLLIIDKSKVAPIIAGIVAGVSILINGLVMLVDTIGLIRESKKNKEE